MRTLIASLIMSFTIAFQAQALESKCYPEIPQARDWPVCVIYLHGLHPANDRGGYTRYERQNRPILDQFTDNYLINHKCRLAAPVAAKRKGGSKLDWQHRSLASVEAAARNACGGRSVKLAKGRQLI